MKRLTCEMCGSTDLIKQDGVFVCQSCGCKYSVEEARKMMIEGTVEVTGTVRVDDSEAKKEQIHNYFQMAQSAYDSQDYEGAVGYYDRILEIDANNFEAWRLKTKAAAEGSTIQNYKEKIPSAIIAAKRAVELAPDINKYEISANLYSEIKSQIQSVFKKAKPTLHNISLEEAFDFVHNIMVQWQSALLDIPCLGKSLMESEINDCEKLESDSATANLFRGASMLKNKNNRYYATIRTALSEKIKMEGAREEEFKANAKAAADSKRAAYWNAHADEKMALDQRKAEAEAKKVALEAELEALPELARKKEINEKIATLRSEQERLGLFKMKEKKALQAKIDEMKTSLLTIEKSLAEKTSPIQEKIDAEKAIIAEVDAELVMER